MTWLFSIYENLYFTKISIMFAGYLLKQYYVKYYSPLRLSLDIFWVFHTEHHTLFY